MTRHLSHLNATFLNATLVTVVAYYCPGLGIDKSFIYRVLPRWNRASPTGLSFVCDFSQVHSRCCLALLDAA